MQIGLGLKLDELYASFNYPDSAADPIQIVRRYPRADDREAVGFCAASLAFGRVGSVLQSIERLLAVMEAERELPPILQVGFARHPRAREGWDAMSALRRRGHLFGIFYYRTPDARARRIDKMLDDASALAEKMSNKKK